MNRNPRIETARYTGKDDGSRDWCVKVDGQHVRAGGRSQRIRTFLTEDAAYKAGERELAEGAPAWMVVGARVDYHARIGGPVTEPNMIVRFPKCR